ncbi:hypothetical protein RCC89_00440 [Cytophagaceae bacterium ABcell3]|nr:hypothetical protein RCC89_00440 [Cytophagaceae bacterium ABcell3]
MPLVQKYSVTILIVVLGLVFHLNYIDEFPAHIHAWAQADRYALALGFLNNGFNFFKPEMFIMNHQFPHDWEVAYTESITAVDFPIHDYLSAVLMKTTGNDSPLFFRSYVLLYSFLGLFFLFKLSYLITKDHLKSLFILIFAATSPVFVYYQSSFLPSVPSLANAIIGLYLYTKYLIHKKESYFGFGILFLTLPALSRTTFIIPIIAILGVEFLRFLKKENQVLPKVVPVTLSFASIITYFFYNKYLRETYGSAFLNYLLPPRDFNHAKELLGTTFQNWGTEYFSVYHYLTVGLITIGILIFFLKKKISFRGLSWLLLLNALMFLGCILFAGAMLRQFPAHDYYFLDTFFLPILLFITILLAMLPKPEKRYAKVLATSIIIFISLPLIVNASQSQKKRRAEGSRTLTTIKNFTNADKLLDSLNIETDKKILILDSDTPNTPFILMKRKGFSVLNTRPHTIEQALKWDFDYIVLQNKFFLNDVYPVYPEILSRLAKKGDNGYISVCSLTSSEQKQTLFDFFNLNNTSPVVHAKMTFDSTTKESYWRNINTTDKKVFSGTKAGILNPSDLYGVTFKTSDLEEIMSSQRYLHFSSYFFLENIVDAELIVSVDHNGQSIFSVRKRIDEMVKQSGQWEKGKFLARSPEIENLDNHELSVYLYNPNQNSLYIDDWEIKIF